MAKPDESADKIETETPWGTWEELLLACAVHRHGTNSWDSVAVEIQKRSSISNLLHLLTPHHCQQKYEGLKRRYSPQNDAVIKQDDDAKADTVPWLDELRKLRVIELKREVERYDLSIVSLQLKVKRLKEEREQSLREDDNGEEKSDLEKSGARERGEEDKGEGEPGNLLESVATKPAYGTGSERDNQSADESNSDPTTEDQNNRVVHNDEERKPVGTGEDEPDPVGGSMKAAVGDDSCSGSSDSIAKQEPVRESVKAEQDVGLSYPPDLWESVDESKGGGGQGGPVKENSDVQSSASESRKEGGPDMVGSGSISGDEPENEDQSAAVKRICVESQPLIGFLEIVQSHKLGLIFERQLESQENTGYSKLIRQHIDLETIRMRLEGGWYSSCNIKFYRDMLLLLNNAILFFGKKSRESTAAIELRQLISKEMSLQNLKLDLPAEEQTSTPSVPLSPKLEPGPSDSLLLKPKISGLMIVCRKRSSLVAKESGSSSGADRKREQKASLLGEKPNLDLKQPDRSSGNAEEPRTTEKRTGDRFSSGSRSSKKNGKNRNKCNPKKELQALFSQNQGIEPSSSEHLEPKSENTATVAGVKKRSAGAASFLNRMKRSPSTGNGSLLETLKSSVICSNSNKGGAEKKRGVGSSGSGSGSGSGNGQSDGKKKRASRQSLGGRQVKEQESPGKRSVGRPPKRAAAPPPWTPAVAVSGKRSREGVDAEPEPSRRPKKRSRK